jgi:hypothetical protein
MTEVSVNYLTRRAKVSKGSFENDRTTASWKTVRATSLLCLDAVGDGLDFEPEI